MRDISKLEYTFVVSELILVRLVGLSGHLLLGYCRTILKQYAQVEQSRR